MERPTIIITHAMKLPNGDQAIVDRVKLAEYCLNPNHPDGKHKAAVFRKVLGWTAEDAGLLYTMLKSAAENLDATPGTEDRYGKRYTIDIDVGPWHRPHLLRSGWIIREGEEIPRMTTCYLIKKRELEDEIDESKETKN